MEVGGRSAERTGHVADTASDGGFGELAEGLELQQELAAVALEDRPRTAEAELSGAGHNNGNGNRGRAYTPPRIFKPPTRLAKRDRSSDIGEIREGERPFDQVRRDTLFRRALAAADLVSAAIAVAVAILIGQDTPEWGVAAALPLVVIAAKVAGLYDRDEHLLRKTTLDEAPALFQVATVFTLVIWLMDDLVVNGMLGREQVLAMWGLTIAMLVLGRAIGRRFVLTITPPERCLVLGHHEDCEDVARAFESRHSINSIVVGRVPLDDRDDGRLAIGTFGGLADLLLSERVDRVIIAAPSTHDERLLDKIRLVKSFGVKVSVLPRLFEVVGSSVEVDDLGGLTLLGLRRYELTTSSKLLKRGLDIAVSVTALLLLAPLMALVALCIKATSPGPVLFKQKRIGRHGVAFQMLKFRSMYEGADAMKQELADLNEADGLFKIENDPRVTPIGRIIRRTSLDELPQLFNVLRGEMSLVGPRPLVVDEDARVRGWLRRRLDVIPGMTGIWQVLGSSRIPLHEMVKIDYLYRANWSLWLDIKILLRTVPHVFARRGM
jgi:exopolysaccharide biosynthesis polyprenyl glycosylphosphotransferase